MQECWQAKGEFDEHFYAFLKGEITPAYAYLIPKDGRFLIGAGESRGHHGRISAPLRRFTEWLTKEFAFQPVSLERKEAWAIPYNSLFGGDGNAILIGDAAGFHNPFSGEGIRLGIERGIMAGAAVVQANVSGKTLSSLYLQQIEVTCPPFSNTNFDVTIPFSVTIIISQFAELTQFSGVDMINRESKDF